MSEPTLEELLSLSDEDRAAIVAPLGDHSRRRGFVFSPEDLAFCLRDGGGIVGGLVGQLNWGWLYIALLGVPEGLRGRGHGRALVEAAEARAAARGCHGAWVDTFTFQSPGFYQRLGYEPFGVLADYPPGQQRIFFRKALPTAAPS